MQFTVSAPASSANLGPGFDAIGIALDLWNTVTIDTVGEPGKITNTGREAALLEGQPNLTLKAMDWLAREHDRALPPCSLVACTEIPIARGLGSSAAALVSGLVAANVLLDLGLNDIDLFTHAWRMEGHGDNVGAAYFGGAVLAIPGIRDATRLWTGQSLELTTVVFIPEATGATWAARAALPSEIPHADAAFNVATASGLAVGLLTRNHALIAAGMNDRLHEPYRARLFPHLDGMKTAACDAGAIGAALSGAGPTVLAMVPPDRVPEVIAAMNTAGTRLGVHGYARELVPTAAGVRLVGSPIAAKR